MCRRISQSIALQRECGSVSLNNLYKNLTLLKNSVFNRTEFHYFLSHYPIRIISPYKHTHLIFAELRLLYFGFSKCQCFGFAFHFEVQFHFFEKPLKFLNPNLHTGGDEPQTRASISGFRVCSVAEWISEFPNRAVFRFSHTCCPVDWPSHGTCSDIPGCRI